ncbi:MAG: protein TonB [Paracoccaceae bacterium]|jgi:protein TonB
MRQTEALLFLPLAAGLHMGVWAVAPSSMGASATGGPGQAQVTLAAASAQHTALANAWQTPPQTVLKTALRPEQPDASTTQAPPQRPSPPQAGPALAPAPALPAILPAAFPRTAPQPPTNPTPAITNSPAQPQPSAAPTPPAPQTKTDRDVQTPRPLRPNLVRPDTQALIDTTPAAAPAAVPPAPKPAAKPATKPKPAPTPPQRASGGGKAKTPQSGRSGKDATQSTNAATRNALRANWGAKIQGKVLRRLIYPRKATGSGVARIALTIDRGGRLTGLRLAKSSGVTAFDQAALSAVRRAGRFPKAPGALTDPTYTFSMSLTFKP